MADASVQYDKNYYSGNGQDGDRPALKLFTRLARHYLGQGRIVDFGCGPGFLLTHLHRHFEACGVEQSEWASAAARERAGVPVHNALSSLEDGSQDALISVHVVEHIPAPQLIQVLAEWHRVLKPGARALVVTPDANGYAHRKKGGNWIAFTDPTHINLKSHEHWAAVFTSAGFDVKQRFADGLWDFPYVFKALGKLEVFFLGWPTLVQFIVARPMLPAGSGESIIMVLERR